MTTTEVAAAPPAARTGRSWIEDWRPEDEEFWENGGKQVARRNLVWSIFAEHLGFSVWLIWSVSSAFLVAQGFAFSPQQLFLLVALPNLVGALLRVPYTFAVGLVGGRNWTIVSAGLLLVPTLLFAYVVQQPGTPYWVFCVVAATAGLGGGNFASSMANINFFYPAAKKGAALGLNAAGGNLGVALIQLLLPVIVGGAGIFGLVTARESGIDLQLAAYVYAGLAVVAVVAAVLRMDNLTSAVCRPREQLRVLGHRQTWVMSFLYVGTFGSFIGYSAAMPLLIKLNFWRQPVPAVPGIGINFVYYAFLGALVGSMARPLGGWLADRFGGARVTLAAFGGMIAGTLGVLYTLSRLAPLPPPPSPEALAQVATGPGRLPVPAGRRGRRRRQRRRVPVLPRALPAGVRLHRHRQRLDVQDDPGDLPHRGRARHHPAHRRAGRRAARGHQEVLGRDRHHRRGRRPRGVPDPAGLRLAVGRGPAVGHPGRVHGVHVLLRGVRGRHLRRVPASHRRRHQPRDRRDLTAPVTTTHCPYCSLQCGMTLRAGRRLEVLAWPEFPVNDGALCRKGWTAAGLRGHRERLTTPLVRDRATGELTAVTWDDALDLVATRFSELQEAHGKDAVAVFGGGGLTNEKAYLLGKLARVALGTSRIDYNGRWCMSSAASASTTAFGVDRGLPFPLADLERSDVVVLVGSNLAETMPPAARHLDRLRENGGRLVVIDPRRTPTGERADLLLQPVPGTDLPLALGVLHLLDAAGAVDDDYVAARTTGFDEVRRSVASWWPERVERVTGVDADQVRELAGVLAGAGAVTVLTARGAEQHSQGTATVQAWINVALALGMCGRPNAGYGCLTGQGNGQGGREHGQKADQLPGYRMIDDPAAREHVARVWGVSPDSLPGKGLSAYELLDALGTDGGPRALLVHASNIAVSAPNASRVAERLAALDLLVVADVVMSETAAMADVVLPVTQWAEETGTMTNLEGRVVLRQQAVAPPDGVRSDLDVIAGLASRLGSTAAFSTDPETVFAELAAASAGGPRRLRRHHLRQDPRAARRLLALPGRRPPRHPAALRRLLRHPRRPRPLRRRRPRRGGRAAGRRLPGAPDHRPGAGPVPVGRADATHRRPAGRRPLRRAAPHAGRADRRPRRRAGRRHHAPRRADGTGAGGRHHPPRHGLRALPLGRRQPPHQRRPRPVEPDAGVQGLRRARRHHDGRGAATEERGSGLETW